MYNINGKSLFRLNTEVLVEFGDGSTISIRKILHQLAFLQQEDAGGDVGNEVEVVAGDDDRGALLLADALNHVGDSHLRRWVEIVERFIQEKNLRIDDHRSDAVSYTHLENMSIYDLGGEAPTVTTEHNHKTMISDAFNLQWELSLIHI